MDISDDLESKHHHGDVLPPSLPTTATKAATTSAAPVSAAASGDDDDRKSAADLPKSYYEGGGSRYPWIGPAEGRALVKLVGVMKVHDRHVLENAKRKIRTDLDLEEWVKYRHFANPLAVMAPPPCGHLDYINAKDVSPDEFRRRFEGPNLPVMIRGATDSWAASTEWSFERLYERFRHRAMKCGEDDDGYPVRVKLKYFLRYLSVQRDDSPMYVFDSGFDDDKEARGLLHDYSVPPYFTDDLFRLVGEGVRPPYRWFLIGPERSGTCTHIDPLSTSAWNALIHGRKRWVLFPPETDRDLAKGKKFLRKGEDDEAVDYFLNLLPRIKAAGVPGIVEFVQEPGETVFIPGGWWHAVMNITDTVAVTQNFCSRVNFPQVWASTRKGRPRMAEKWLKLLEKDYPHLVKMAAEIDARDGFSLERFLARKRERRRLRREKAREKKAAKRAAKAAAKAGAGGDAKEDDSETSTTSDSSDTASGSSDSSDTTDTESDASGGY